MGGSSVSGAAGGEALAPSTKLQVETTKLLPLVWHRNSGAVGRVIGGGRDVQEVRRIAATAFLLPERIIDYSCEAGYSFNAYATLSYTNTDG